MEKNKRELGIVHYKTSFLNFSNYYHSIDEVFRHYDISENFTNFDFEKKYAFHQYKNIVFVKLNFNDVENWHILLSNVIGKHLTLESANFSGDHEYNKLYQEIISVGEFAIEKTKMY